jgi:two-component sensor histidine kinase
MNAVSAFPDRLIDRAPTLLNKVVAAFACTGLAIIGRLIIDRFSPDLSPFTLVFPCVILATLLAGGRSGAATMILCELLAWYAVLPPRYSFVLNGATFLVLLISTVSLSCTVWGVAAYRSAALRLASEQEKRVEFLSMALAELDHRTKNNFQIAASLLMSQALSHQDPMLQEELQRAAGRLESIAGVYSRLALSSIDLSTVALHEYLREICDRVIGGLLPGEVQLRFAADPVEVPAQAAVSIGLIVNECLTNAIKHAFPAGIGEIDVTLNRTVEGVLVCVADDGVGTVAAEKEGAGSKLIRLLARSLDATFEMRSDQGTRCELTFPLRVHPSA